MCADGDLIALQSIRVAAPIPAFVVPAGDLVGRLQQRLLCKIIQIMQHLGSQHTVGLHDLEFLRGQPAGLVEDLFVNADFSDVVQGRSQRDHILLFRSDRVSAADLQQTAEQQFGDDTDVPHMGAAFAVAEFYDMAQYTHQHIRVIFTGADLLRDHLHQPPLLGVQLDGVGHTAVHDTSIEGAIDIITCAQLIGTPDRRIGVLAGDHNDRDILDGVVGIHGFQHFKAVHNGHIDVQQHQCNVSGFCLQFFHAFPSVFDFQNVVAVSQDLCQHHAVHCGVIHK